MTNENSQLNSCRYADVLVSYLYDEASAAEKSRFEAHLVNCSSCAEELADFSSVRTQIAEWRETEFQPLAIPAIELPVQKVSFAPEISNSGSLLIRLRALFSPAWMGAGVTAILVICIGLILVVLNVQREPETARSESETTIKTDASPIEKENSKEQISVSENNRKTVLESSTKPSIATNEENKAKSESFSVKVSQPMTPTGRKKIYDEKFVKPKKTVPKKSPQSPPPTLMADEDEFEDNSLRLSDIFRGSGGK